MGAGGARDGEFIGFTGLIHHAFLTEVEVGWRLSRASWGHGYATEAARAAVAYAFDELELPELVSMTTVANVRSRAVMERLGMTRNPADDFDHPNVPEDSPVRRTVLYRLPNPSPAAQKTS